MTDHQDTPAPSRTHSASLLNRAEVRRFILDTLGRTRLHLRITRVSREALYTPEAWLRAKIESEVHSHPSVGKTFKL